MLEQLPYIGGRITRQISAENPTGNPGNACRWKNANETLDGGKNLKVHPFLQLSSGETKILADMEGPGCITEIFFTCDHVELSELVLRIYWDNEENPSVETPVGMFFANGFDAYKHEIHSAVIMALPRNAYSCYWQMPFKKHATITLTHGGTEKISCIAYRVMYQLYDIPDHMMYFHASYHRENTSFEKPIYTILDHVEGEGCYVGTYLAWNALHSDWWGEGEVKFYIDDDGFYPSMADNGTEDYFGGSFGFSPFNSDLCWNEEQTFSAPYMGMPLAVTGGADSVRKYSLYRWHIYDNIGFRHKLRVTVDTIGLWDRQGYRPLDEDIASVAYWYQCEPHRPYKRLPSAEQRMDR
ncbi:DUF2961 domain-containing protein [Blautia liquoris]|uniref:DUF2961 domain-containing protein n=1 Tax=Blautia liquoris TaxID=2779518 RepID=A0A7M2RK46_9FIRM|nr:glycoside hydrolase family 172 protein [Blautia liquoris]QOV19937.1 DUF2961 domain-containing protein [Blautia liquoris]